MSDSVKMKPKLTQIRHNEPESTFESSYTFSTTETMGFNWAEYWGSLASYILALA